MLMLATVSDEEWNLWSFLQIALCWEAERLLLHVPHAAVLSLAPRSLCALCLLCLLCSLCSLCSLCLDVCCLFGVRKVQIEPGRRQQNSDLCYTGGTEGNPQKLIRKIRFNKIRQRGPSFWLLLLLLLLLLIQFSFSSLWVEKTQIVIRLVRHRTRWKMN